MADSMTQCPPFEQNEVIWLAYNIHKGIVNIDKNKLERDTAYLLVCLWTPVAINHMETTDEKSTDADEIFEGYNWGKFVSFLSHDSSENSL